jgi:hypothetical protein
MVGVLALLMLSSQPVVAKLEVSLRPPKSEYRPGETVEVSLSLRNVSKEPGSIVRSWSGGQLFAKTGMELFRDGQPVEVMFEYSSAGPIVLGVGRKTEVVSDRFMSLPAGGRAKIHVMSFSKEIRWKGETSTLAPLEPGVYEVRGFYEFNKDEKGSAEPPFEFTPSAKRLWDIAFSGRFEGTARFRVVK